MQVPLEDADREVQEALAEFQKPPGTSPTPKQVPTISIRELVQGDLELEKIFTVDDFLGTEEVLGGYDLEQSEQDELQKLKTDAAKEIQAAIQTMFKGALERAQQAMEQQRQYTARLEGKKRKTNDGGAAACGAKPSEAQDSQVLGQAAAASVEQVQQPSPKLNVRERLVADEAVRKAAADAKAECLQQRGRGL